MPDVDIGPVGDWTPCEVTEFTSYHVGVAAEAVVASLFARCGYDVSVQYGANQPGYDLIVSKGKAMCKVSVKGSKDGGWGLTQSFLTWGEADYHAAIDRWLTRQPPGVVLALVQYQHVGLTDMPRAYLATAQEIAERMRTGRGGHGDTILWENHSWVARAAAGAGTTDRIPPEWTFSEQRIADLLHGQTP